MGILAVTTPVNPFAPLWPTLLLAMTLASGIGLGLFRRRSIVGPIRLDNDGPVEGLTIAMIVGYFVWVGVPTLIHLLVVGGIPGPTTAPVEQPLDAKSIFADLCARVIVIAILAGSIIALRCRPRRLGIAPEQIIPGLLRALAGMLFVAPLMLMVLVGTDQLWKYLNQNGHFVHDSLTQLGNAQGWKIRTMLLISIVVAAPISEELFFRGCIQTLVASWIGRLSRGSGRAWTRWLAVVLTSLLFAWAHVWWSRPPIFILALSLGYAYERTGNLWTSIGLHALFNGAEVILFFHNS